MKNYDQLLQRRKAIEAGLLELMQTVPYDQISITDLAHHLNVSRKSFYHYFPGKEACLHSLINRMIQECALYISQWKQGPEDFHTQYLRNLEYWRSQADFLNAVIQNDLMFVFMNHCIQHVSREEKDLQFLLQHPEAEYDQDVLLFYINGQISLLLSWCHRGFDTPIEEMARKTMRLIHSPLIPLKEPPKG